MLREIVELFDDLLLQWSAFDGADHHLDASSGWFAEQVQKDQQWVLHELCSHQAHWKQTTLLQRVALGHHQIASYLQGGQHVDYEQLWVLQLSTLYVIPWPSYSDLRLKKTRLQSTQAPPTAQKGGPISGVSTVSTFKGVRFLRGLKAAWLQTVL